MNHVYMYQWGYMLGFQSETIQASLDTQKVSIKIAAKYLRNRIFWLGLKI